MSFKWHAAHALVGGVIEDDVLIEIVDGRFASVTPGSPRGDANKLPGLVLPSFANVHSHAFHRALRGRTHSGRGSFWTWRDRMYEVAGSLDPDGYHRLARAVYGEMAMAGITAVGEFHYLHHTPTGGRYADPNAMGEALIAAAADAGIRITLLDTLYLTSSVDGKPPEGVQRRFSDGTADAWIDRVTALKPLPHARIGAAAHSVRAVPERELAALAGRAPLHVHLSEQRAENEQCQAVHGCTPTELLRRNGILGPGTTVVHATHLTDGDVGALSGTGVCLCPTTERDLADGIGPARALTGLSLGSDSHAVIDVFEEMRGVEMNERLATERRGHFTVAELLAAATNHAAIGWDDAGEIAVGMRADLVALSLTSVRTAGTDPAQAILAATAADITTVIADGRLIVADGRHLELDVAAELGEAIPA
ncbi:formimidoylglutamate deiminase [Actinoplanes sp. NBRC 103695]|uniref:formimidoylglutamate deiminase n=1 Tax=Actinoplanes sp. NBRC 103695 TaxID=3032202 RepID=UPI0024A26083|nr:formimidoylglutamate deiminase [Actinoplanes sp. NBRC 103695]GLY97413.1 formimidoylglutamate deiminase [Actinoplanes sp. NBRC 103695]